MLIGPVLIGPVLIGLAAAGIDYAALRTVDRQLATIAHRLVTANAPICAERAPAPGLVLHARDQYVPGERARVTSALGFPALIAVEAVVAGSAAARAGVAEGDGLIAVNGHRMPQDEGASASSAHRDAAHAVMEMAPADAPLELTLRRDGHDRLVMVPASPGCRSSFELVLGPDLVAHADGRTVQIGSAWFARVSDDEVAVLVAHELAHNILRHRARLDAAGVSRGMLAEVGRNGRLIRRTEEEADRLSVHLLRNAGYDPRIAIRFWQGPGDKADGGLFRSRTHAGAKRRAKLIEAEITAIPADAGAPYAPPVLRTGDEVLE